MNQDLDARAISNEVEKRFFPCIIGNYTFNFKILEDVTKFYTLSMCFSEKLNRGGLLALKVIPLEKQISPFKRVVEEKMVLREIDFIKKFQEFVCFPELICHKIDNGVAYTLTDYYFTDMGTVFSFFQVDDRLPKFSLLVIAPILDALSFMHKEGVIHRSVCVKNIKIGHTGIPILTDFLFSVECEKGQKSVEYDKDYFHIPYCTPPEYINKEAYSHKYDSFSIGIALCRLLCGKPSTALFQSAVGLFYDWDDIKEEYEYEEGLIDISIRLQQSIENIANLYTGETKKLLDFLSPYLKGLIYLNQDKRLDIDTFAKLEPVAKYSTQWKKLLNCEGDLDPEFVATYREFLNIIEKRSSRKIFTRLA